MLFQHDGVWPVIVPRRYDIEIADNQTLRRPCGSCGVEINLAHLQDLDSYRLWYGGFCGRCGAEQDVEVGGDTLHCRDCATPLLFISTDEWCEQMYCPQCHPEAPADEAADRALAAKDE